MCGASALTRWWRGSLPTCPRPRSTLLGAASTWSPTSSEATSFGGWLEALHRGGCYVTSGAIAGPIVELDLRTLYLNDLRLEGATVHGPQAFADLVGYIERGEVSPVVGGTFPLAEIGAAQAAFMAKSHIGSLVIELP